MFTNNNNQRQPPQLDTDLATSFENKVVFTSTASPGASSSSSCCNPSPPSLWCSNSNHNSGGSNSSPQIKQRRKKRLKKTQQTQTIDNNNDAHMISRELLELSASEREKAYDELHGVGKSKFDESNETFVKSKLQQMTMALDNNTNNVPVRKIRDYHRALLYWPQLRIDRDFLLLFLRTDDFDPIKASKRLVTYYIQKRLVFGDSKLVKQITMDDLSPSDINVFQSGCMMELPYKDQCSRPIVYCDMNKYDPSTMTIDNMIKATWYMMITALTSTKVAQQKGICYIMQTPSKDSNNYNPELANRVGYIHNNCFPGKVTAFHAFYDTPNLEHWILNNIISTLGRYNRMRFRGHIGSDIEIEYGLLQFGIRLDGFLQKQSASSGDNNTMFHQYVKHRMEIDDQYNETLTSKSKQLGYVAYPYPNDVLIGRGKPYREWIGNTIWNDIIDKYAIQYRDAETRFDKGLVAYHVLEDYKISTKARFLLEPQQQQQQDQDQGDIHDNDGSGNVGRTSSVMGVGWKVLDLDSAETKDKATLALQNRVKALSREAIKATNSGIDL